MIWVLARQAGAIQRLLTYLRSAPAEPRGLDRAPSLFHQGLHSGADFIWVGSDFDVGGF